MAVVHVYTVKILIRKYRSDLYRLVLALLSNNDLKCYILPMTASWIGYY